MTVKSIISIGLHTGALLLALVGCMSPTHAQSNDTVPSIWNAVTRIREALKAYLKQQPEQTNAGKPALQTGLNGLSVKDSLSNPALQQMKQLTNKLIDTVSKRAAGMWQNEKQVLKLQPGKHLPGQDIKKNVSRFAGMLKEPLLQRKEGSIHINGQKGPSVRRWQYVLY